MNEPPDHRQVSSDALPPEADARAAPSLLMRLRGLVGASALVAVMGVLLALVIAAAIAALVLFAVSQLG